MALTDIEKVWNLALGLIGDYAIVDGETNTEQYIICDRYYDSARKRTLKAHPWNESVKRVIIPEETYGPIFEFSNKFSLPSDHLKIISINSDGIDYDVWEVEGIYIKTDDGQTPQVWNDDSTLYSAGEYVSLSDITYLCNVNNTSATANSPATDAVTWTTQGGDLSVIYVRYIYDNTDPALWSEDLKNAVATQLAILISTKLTNDTKTKTSLIQEFEQLVMPKARSVDAQEGKPRDFFRSSWIRSRSSFTRRY